MFYDIYLYTLCYYICCLLVIKEKLGDKAIFPPANALNSRASSVAALALDKAKRGETQSYLEMKPYYIRKSQAERELEERENKEKGESK